MRSKRRSREFKPSQTGIGDDNDGELLELQGLSTPWQLYRRFTVAVTADFYSNGCVLSWPSLNDRSCTHRSGKTTNFMTRPRMSIYRHGESRLVHYKAIDFQPDGKEWFVVDLTLNLPVSQASSSRP